MLIITGPRHVLQSAIDVEDEPRLRAPIPDLSRVDMRYCPSWRHAALLLSLLSSDPNPSSTELIEKPGLFVLSDLSGLFDQDMDEAKENVPPPPPTNLLDEISMEAAEDEEKEKEGKRELSKDAWQYLSMISAAKQTASALGAALIVLEHRPCPLPLPASNRCVEMSAALQKLLGHVVTVTGKLSCLLELTTETGSDEYEVSQGGERFGMRRREVGKDEYALPPIRTGNEETAWEWSWV